MSLPAKWRTSIFFIVMVIFMAIKANALRVAVISLQQACGSNSSIYLSEGSNATICATVLYIDGSPTLPRNVVVTLVATDITAQYPNDYSPRATSVTFPSGSVEGQNACSDFLVLNDMIVEITETFSVTLTTSDPDVTIGNCDGIGVPSFTIYIKGNNSLQPSMPVQALLPSPTIACSQAIPDQSCLCPISSPSPTTPTIAPTSSPAVPDRTPPILTFLRNPLSSNQDITISWTFNKPVDAHCTLLSPTYVALPFPCSTSFSVTNLVAGEYTLFIYAVDLVGSYALEVSHSWIVDLTPPLVYIASYPPASTYRTDWPFAFYCSNKFSCNYQCSVQLSSSPEHYEPCNNGYFLASNLQNGQSYTISVFAIDGVGNLGTPSRYTWTVDTISPTIQTLNGYTVSCGAAYDPSITGTPGVSDNIDPSPSLTYSNNFASMCTLNRVWRVTDAAGNFAQTTQVISFINLRPPEFVAPSDSYVPCAYIQDALQSINPAGVFHPCDRPFTRTYSDSYFSQQCGVNFVRTWTVVDDCGQSAMFTQNIHIMEQQLPAGPVYNQINVNLRAPLGWPSYVTAIYCYVFIWVQGTSQPTQPVAVVNSPSYFPSTSYVPGSTIYWQIQFFIDSNNFVPTPVWGFQTLPYPDLSVTVVSLPLSAFSGQQIQISWTVTNVGSSNTGIYGWRDGIYIGHSTDIESSTLVNVVYIPTLWLDPQESYSRSITVKLGRSDVGAYNAFVATDLYQQIDDVNRTNNRKASSNSMNVVRKPTPDLVVDSISTQSSANSGTYIQITWTVRNDGAGVTDATFWYDRVYWSTNQYLDGYDRIIGTYGYFGSLVPQASYQRTIKFFVPNAIFGNYYILVYTDIYSYVYEYTSENNNIGTSSYIPIVLSPTPDLVVSQIQCQDTYRTGDTMRISYTVANVGAGKPFEIFWQDVLKLTSVSTGSSYIFNVKGHYGTLYPNGSYTNQINYYIGARVPTGSYVVAAFADYYNNVFEYSAKGNNYGTKNVNIAQSLSNLVASGVSYSVTTSTMGNTLQLYFNVMNLGTGPATNPPWGDRVGISYSPTLYYSSTRFLGRFVQSYALLPNGGYYTRSLTTMVPNYIFGNVYLFVQVDYTNRITESNKQDNIYTIGPFVMPIVLPDLSVSSFSIDGLLSPLYAGTTIVLDWMVVNIGTGIGEGVWRDSFYLSTTPVSSNQIKVSDVTVAASIQPATGYYSKSIGIRLPSNYVGIWYITVNADNYRTLNENNRLSNNMAVLLLNILQPPTANLRVSLVNYNFMSLQRVLTVFWSVINDGNSMVTTASWVDEIFLSVSSVPSPYNSISIGKMAITGRLLSNQQYTRVKTIILPPTVYGVYYLVIKTDSYNSIMELNGESNNVGNAGIAYFRSPPSPKLLINFNIGYLPTGLIAGNQVLVTYSVTNIGDYAITAGSWTDGIYFSTYSTNRYRVMSEGTLLKRVLNTRQLTVGQAYYVSTYVNIPYGVNNILYLVLVIDITGRLGNPSVILTDVVGTSVLPFLIQDGFLSDLSVTLSPEASSVSVTSGQPAIISYTVSNVGQRDALGVWYESLYLSIDASLDSYDIQLRTVRNLNTLPINSAYTRIVSVFVPFSLVSGNYYLFYQVDRGNRIVESNKNNNIISNVITIVGTVSADIAVTQVQTFPEVVHFGDSVTFQWRVRNNGAVQANGYECDTLYLSKDAVWDVYDYMIGSPPCRSIAIQPYQNNSANDQIFSYAYTVPFISEGSYIGIVRIQTNIRDPSLQNNVGYAIAHLQVVSQTQLLNTPVVHSLVTGAQLLYKIINVPVKNTLIANLVIAGSNAYHNVYLNYRNPATSSVYDGYSRVLLSSQQKAIVANTKGGDYFITVQSFGSIIEMYTITFFVQIANFEIFQISPSLATPNGKTTVRFYGTQFNHYIAASIVSNTFGEMYAQNVYWYSSVELYATFDLSAVAPGLYSMRLTNTITRNFAQLNDCFRVTAGLPGHVVVLASITQVSRNTQTAIMTIRASNNGGTDLITPLVLVTVPQNTVVQLNIERAHRSYSSTSGFFLQPINGPAGVVSPGVVVDLQFSVILPATGSQEIKIIQIQNNLEPHPFIAQKQTLQPVEIPSIVWDSIWNNFIQSLGDTWSTLYSRASEVATKLSLVQRQEYVLDTIVNFQLQVSYGLLTGNSIVSVGDLNADSGTHLQLSLERHYSSYIQKRRTAGPLGMGWLLGWWERRLQFIDSNTIMMWNERETIRFVSNGAGEFFFNNDVITITIYGIIYVDYSSNLRYTFDSSSGYLFEIRSIEDNSSIQFTYMNGTLNFLTHSNGQKLDVVYDEAGNIVNMDILDSTNSITQTSLYTYDPSGLYLVAVTVGNLTTTYNYNDNGDLAEILYSSGNRKVLEYDETNLLSAVKSYGNASDLLFSISRTNNWNGNVQLTIQPRNTTIEVTYDTSGRIASCSVDGGISLVEVVNSSGRVIYLGGELIVHQYLEDGYWYLTNANSDTASYKFDEYNQLLVFTDRNGNSYTSVYDNVNNTAASLQYPDLTNVTLVYDNNGNISSIVNRDSTVSSYDYDSQGNLIQKSLDNDVASYGYSTTNQLIQANNIIGTVNITYDSSGAPIQLAYPNGHTIDYSYDNGRRTSMSIDEDYKITYHYDSSGARVIQINLSNRTDTPVMLVQFSYYTSGQIQRKTLGNRQYTTYNYMGLKSRLSEMNTYTSSDDLLSSYIYKYDDEGRIVSVTTLSGTFNYSYDGIGQMTGWTNPIGETTLFTYDGNGNRVSEVKNGVKATYVANIMNQYLQYNETDSFVYDQNGNLKQKTTTDGTQYFSFNSESKLVKTQRDILSCSYQYDATGHLFRKNCSDMSVYDYVIDPFGRTGSDIVLESLNGVPTYFIHCPTVGLVAQIDTSISFYHFDPVGSVTHLVGDSDSILNTYKYDPFGRVLQQSQQKRNPYQYAGQHGVTITYELESMYMMPSGHYDAQHGRFINTDVEGTHRNIQNGYLYALNSPLLQLNPADSTLSSVLSELLVGSNSSVLLYSLTADLSGDPFWEGSDIIKGAFALKGSFSNTLENRIILPTISTVVGPQKENSINGAALLSATQFQIISKTPPLAGAVLLRKTFGSLLLQQSVGLTGPLVNMVPSSILENVSQNYTENIVTVSTNNTDGQEPNEVIGTMGIGDAHFVSSSTTLKYTVYFENNPNASLPAQRVLILYPLDDNLDLRTFMLEQIAFNTFTSEIILNMASIETTYDATATSGVLVRVKGGLDLTTKQASWEFQALDPVTGQPPLDQSVGFLPPNNGTTGQGYVSFTVMAYNQTEGLVQINASAQVTFDQDEPFDTQPFINTIDDIAPMVNLSILGIEDTNLSVVLQITSSDVGSGVAKTSIYEVADNGTVSLLTETTATMAVVQLSSNFSKLLCIPQDNVGNMPTIQEQMNNLLVVNISSVVGVCPGSCLGNGICTSYGVCMCNSGFIGQNCSEDINECATNNTLGPCEQICTNIIGSFYCSCREGYLLSEYNCTDIDECMTGNSNCSQVCENSIGSYHCSCIAGYMLSSDSRTCIDINECNMNGGKGPCDQICTNTIGSFACSCQVGYTIVGFACNDINECSASNGGLGPCGQICTNTNGSFVCSCQPGYSQTGYNCNDINECLPNGGRGPCEQICTNNDGSFNCSCQSGFSQSEYNCTDINECLSNGGLGTCAQICNNTIGSFVCHCQAGFTAFGNNCTDIDECTDGISGCSQTCENSIGGYTCGCYPGYGLSVDTKTCVVINQCARNAGKGNCDQICTPTNGSFYCSCLSGYSLNGYSCDDINECASNGGHGPCDQHCTNTNGSFYCSCQPGFIQFGYACNDINECTPNGGRGQCEQMCTNTNGSYYCSCQTGYTLSGYSCNDINECAPNNGLGPCGQICTNTNGSFLCSCQQGYDLSGYSCYDIDECALQTSGCNQVCDNNNGSFACSCNPGFQMLPDNKTCTDINECVPNGGHGPCDQICTNTPGSFSCNCQSGYNSLGWSCVDINECAPNEGQGPCNQTCMNTNGSFLCSCQPGYTQSGYQCNDINECTLNGGRGPCDQSCTNAIGTFYCSCSSGYILSGYNCSDINECTPNNGKGPCSQVCSNAKGSFFCSCDAGYSLNGYECYDINECALGISGCTQLCNNTIGGFKCGCSIQFELSSDNKTCTPINPCSSNGGRGPCEQICFNESICTCLSGYAMDGYNCLDINECAQNGGHGPCDQICTNTNGSFLCSCQPGYTLSEYACFDINECLPNGGRGMCDQTCTNTNGSFNCGCQIGYTSIGNNCSDIDECNPNGGNGPCEQNCTNEIGSFMCSCKPGFALNGYNCDDIDECYLGTSGCAQNCSNSIGSFSCSCYNGYELSSNNKNCNDIDECMVNGGLGPCDQICSNNPGSFSCICATGYILSGFVCNEINECALNGGLGPCDQLCINTNGSFSCDCLPGYMHTLSQYSCSDINECTSNGGLGPCDQTCINTNGTFACSCQSGFSQNGYACNDINECALNAGLGPCSQFCVNTLGTFSCGCQSGYILSGYDCNDIDECSLGTSGCSQECMNTNGTFICQCYPGYQLSSDNKTCITINECASSNGQGRCQQLCTPTNGSFFCDCQSGYSLSGYNCSDINECGSNGGQGPCNQFCTNTIGSFLCKCQVGYTEDGYNCTDIDECAINGERGPCDQICTNTAGSFFCSCQPGYNQSGYDCSDVDECLQNEGMGPCAQNCTNTVGSFQCSCKQGYSLSGYNCLDIDECNLGISGCSQLCTNSIGSFECGCYHSYQLSSNNKSCIVIDQCASNGGLGPCNQICSNANGSFYCSCRAGYSLSGNTCYDIDECEPHNGLGPCNQTCTNLNGSFYCSCQAGYQPSGYNCNDINECTLGSSSCSQECQNIYGSYLCGCLTGYQLLSDNSSCIDINECLPNNGTGPCNQSCTNVAGSFYCTCQPGYQLSGYSCSDIDECSLGISGCSQLCINTFGSYVCKCLTGYQLSSDNNTCIDTNECALEGSGCTQLCANTNGSFRCGCLDGFELIADNKTCIDTGQHIPVVHLTGFDAKEDAVIHINISADLPLTFIQPNYGVFLTVTPTPVSLSRGNFNGTGWTFTPSDFGEVDIFPLLHFSGNLFLQATSINGNTTDEASLNVTIVPIANIPNLTTNLSSPCYPSANSTLFLSINSSLVDNDGSERLQVFILNLPDSITIPNIEKNSNGVYVISNLPTIVELKLTGTPLVNFTVYAESTEKINGDKAFNSTTTFINICEVPSQLVVVYITIIVVVITGVVACIICVLCFCFCAVQFRRRKNRMKTQELITHVVLDVKEGFQPQSVFIVINETDKHIDEDTSETKL